MNAYFVMSVADIKNLPPPVLPEVVFAGRSNVGKSSLMNKILERKNLVKTGKTPGKTRLINLFSVNDQAMFVDLPGYGYAAVSKAELAGWHKLIDAYFTSRRKLALCFVLVDVRRFIREEERMLLRFLDAHHIPSCTILTKADKLSKNQLLNQKTKIAKDIGVNADELIHFSAVTGEGKEEIRKTISEKTGLEWG